MNEPPGYKPFKPGRRDAPTQSQRNIAKAFNRLDSGDGLLDLARMSHEPIPVRQWLVRDLIPMFNVTQLSGDGALGKSLLVLQLMVCRAIGVDWLGQPTTPGKSLGIFCEDDAEEIHRRLYEICGAYGVEIADVLEHVDIVTRVGEDNALMTFSRWGEEPPAPTPLYQKMHASCLAHAYSLVVLDSSHDLFIGNENDRTQVRQFVGSLRAIALKTDCAVMLNSHPSITGMNTRTGSSGSTAWNNAVRSRLYLTLPEGATDRKYRTLKTMKANYAAGDTEISLEWDNGIMIPSGTFGTAAKAMVKLQTGAALPLLIEKLRMFTERGRYMSPHDNHPRDYIVKVMLDEPEFHGFDKGHVIALVQRAVGEKLIETITIPKARKGTWRQVLVPMGFRPPAQSKIDFAAAQVIDGIEGRAQQSGGGASDEEPPPPSSPEDYGGLNQD